MAERISEITVGFDKRPTEAGFKAHAGRGTGRYVEALSTHLRNLSQGSDFQLIELSRADLEGNSWLTGLRNLLPLGKTTFEVQLALPWVMNGLSMDVVHFCSHGDSPAFSKKSSIVTVLDLIPLKFPELYKAPKQTWRFNFARWLELQAIRRARGIIAISEATKRDLIEILGIEEDRIKVTHLAVDFERLRLDRTTDPEVFKNRHSLPSDRPLLSYLGGIDPRKNLIFLLRVLNSLKQRASDPTKVPALVLAGRIESDSEYPKLQKLISQMQLEQDVYEVGFLDDSELADFFRSSEAFVFPSLYEGFGFPVLEAMAAGVPVIAGDNSSLPELTSGSKCGESGVFLLEDDKLEDWVAKVEELLFNPQLANEVGQSGTVQARKFSWERCAKETYDAYRYFLTN